MAGNNRNNEAENISACQVVRTATVAQLIDVACIQSVLATQTFILRVLYSYQSSNVQ